MSYITATNDKSKGLTGYQYALRFGPLTPAPENEYTFDKAKGRIVHTQSGECMNSVWDHGSILNTVRCTDDAAQNFTYPVYGESIGHPKTGKCVGLDASGGLSLLPCSNVASQRWSIGDKPIVDCSSDPAGWYYQQNPAVKASGVGAKDHYCSIGKKAGLAACFGLCPGELTPEQEAAAAAARAAQDLAATNAARELLLAQAAQAQAQAVATQAAAAAAAASADAAVAQAERDRLAKVAADAEAAHQKAKKDTADAEMARVNETASKRKIGYIAGGVAVACLILIVCACILLSRR